MLPKHRTLSILALGMMALPALLGMALCVVRPDRIAVWVLGMIGVPVLVTATSGLRQFENAIAALSDETMFQRQRAVSVAVIWACLVVALPMAARLADALGLVNPSLAEAMATRWANVLAGGFLVSYGNRLPKVLLPLANCDNPATIQAIRRRTGRTYSLTGLAFTIGWLALPAHLAQPISFAILVAGIVMPAVIMQIRTRHCYEQPTR